MHKKLAIPAFLILIILGAYYVLGQDTVTNNIPVANDSIDLLLDTNDNAVGDVITGKTALEEETQLLEASGHVLIPSKGFGLESLGRGIIGILTLLFLAFLLSTNRRAISWRIVIIGLLMQVVIAIGVLRVDAVESVIAALDISMKLIP